MQQYENFSYKNLALLSPRQSSKVILILEVFAKGKILKYYKSNKGQSFSKLWGFDCWIHTYIYIYKSKHP